MGLLNNASYCILLACAKNISEGGTALVFICNVFPAIFIKASAPYWFHKITYAVRLRVAAVLMAVAFFVVAICHGSNSIRGELFGVAIMSTGGGLGEASLLALAGKYDLLHGRPSRRISSTGSIGEETTETNKASCITCFSSGTGLSGVLGFLWKVSLTEWFGFTLESSLLLGMSLAALYSYVFQKYLSDSDLSHDSDGEDDERDDQEHAPLKTTTTESNHVSSIQEGDSVTDSARHSLSIQPYSSHHDALHDHHCSISITAPLFCANARVRFRQVMALWPYTVPLFTVYAAEYACMAGAWTAIGFPVDQVSARNHFYTASNWLYQVGVFISRSSGTIFTVSLPVLWFMPILQCGNLLFFVSVATIQAHGASTWMYNPLLFYGLSLYTGLLGGAVYVHGYKRIVLDRPQNNTEFALAATSVAEAIGILVADVLGLFLQSCLYKANQIDGAVVSCPL
jgi:battenin